MKNLGAFSAAPKTGLCGAPRFRAPAPAAPWLLRTPPIPCARTAAPLRGELFQWSADYADCGLAYFASSADSRESTPDEQNMPGVICVAIWRNLRTFIAPNRILPVLVLLRSPCSGWQNVHIQPEFVVRNTIRLDIIFKILYTQNWENQMRCYFCKRDENDTNQIFSPLIALLEKKKSELDIRINEMNYRLEIGLIKENSEKVKSINGNILSTRIDYFERNLNVLVKLDASLEFLKLYLNKPNLEISNTDTLSSLVNLYLKESTDGSTHLLKDALVNKRERILSDIEQIHENMKFHEITDYQDINLISKFEKEMMAHVINEEESYSEIDKDKEQEKTFLCPFCWRLFNTNQFIKEINSKIRELEIKQLEGSYDYIKQWNFD
jgi:hypothetical protein